VAPEIDATSAVAGLTLMIGGLVVVRGRRRKIAIAKN
jgi:LPXTG-motif cell wall-anchored protein